MSRGEFFYDIVCPYAYMAFTVLMRDKAFATKLTLRPILLGGLFKMMESPTDPNVHYPEAKKNHTAMNMARSSAYYGVPLHRHPRHPVPTLGVMRLLHACKEDQLMRLTEHCFRAYWVDNAAIDSDEFIESTAAMFGIAKESLLEEDIKAKLKAAVGHAFNSQVFGVPTVRIDEENFFGVDRLTLIRDPLGLSLPELEWPADKRTVEFIFDFSSPYSYLGYAAMKKAESRGVQVKFTPVLLGAIFKSLKQTTIPLLSAHEHKAKYLFKDMTDWAKKHRTQFVFNSHFPLRTVHALRVALVEPKTIGCLYEAAWVNNQDLGDEEVLKQVLGVAGFAGEALLEKANSESIKAALRKNTEYATERGVFGLPSFLVDNQLFFGQDSLHLVKAHLKEVG